MRWCRTLFQPLVRGAIGSLGPFPGVKLTCAAGAKCGRQRSILAIWFSTANRAGRKIPGQSGLAHADVHNH